MPNWGKVLEEIDAERIRCIKLAQRWENKSHQARNKVRHDYLEKLHKATGRNIICYYSGWLSKPNEHPSSIQINDEDMNGFMMAVHGLDKSLGLDLFLHTPGGELHATQAIVSYLHTIFDGNIRAVIPEIAMSAGTITACCCKSILMGKHSSLGPIDPQIGSDSADAVRKCFEDAVKEIGQNGDARFAWDSILRKYPLTFLTNCESVVEKSKEFVREKLTSVMFEGDADAANRADKIVSELAQAGVHSEHIMLDRCIQLGLNIEPIEGAKGLGGIDLQDLLLTVHHCYMHLLMNTNAHKIIENHNSVALVKNSPSN